MLEQVYVGDFYFETLKLLRSSLLLSVLTHNSEIWPSITAQQVKNIESVESQMTSQKDSKVQL